MGTWRHNPMASNVLTIHYSDDLLLSLKKYYSPQTFKRSFIITAVFAIAVFAFEFYNYYNLPLVDFRPFKEGADIKKGSFKCLR
jgi:hypothetical protein